MDKDESFDSVLSEEAKTLQKKQQQQQQQQKKTTIIVAIRIH